MFRHILPNALQPVIVYATVGIGGAILCEAALSFLGVGVLPPEPSWGLMVSRTRDSCRLPAPAVLPRRGHLPHRARLRARRRRPARRPRPEDEAVSELLAVRPGPPRRLPTPKTASCRPSTACRSTSHRGEVLAIVGESGSGKSVSSLAVMGLLPRHRQGRPASIQWKGARTGRRRRPTFRKIRGRRDRHDLPGPALGPEPGATGSAIRSARRSASTRVSSKRGRRRRAVDAARPRSASRSPTGGPDRTRTSSPAACASGR